MKCAVGRSLVGFHGGERVAVNARLLGRDCLPIFIGVTVNRDHDEVAARSMRYPKLGWYGSTNMCYKNKMDFEPDILVTSRDGRDRLLVVEVKLSGGGCDLEETERQIKRYMVGYRYPTGMVATPDVLRIYRDTFSSYEESSVEQVAELSTAGLLDRDILSIVYATENPELRAYRFEDAVQSWLDSLTDAATVAALPAEAREAVEGHIVPAVEHGEVRAAGPRWQRRRTGT